jgi:ABC-type Mn2+/Zn2+ transport system permease subunit
MVKPFTFKATKRKPMTRSHILLGLAIVLMIGGVYLGYLYSVSENDNVSLLSVLSPFIIGIGVAVVSQSTAMREADE